MQVARGARLYMISQAEAGHICPVMTMTHASIATLQRDDGLLRAHLPQLLSRTYDPSDKPMATKTSITVGMGMTEKQGGTDVRANMTRAEPLGEEGRGVPAIIEMVTLTRLDCALASAGLMRFMLANALRHARYRTVFQKQLIDQPLMAQVLADLALDAEAALLLVNAPPYIAEPFVASRLAGGWRQTYGAGLRGAGHNAILVWAAEGL